MPGTIGESCSMTCASFSWRIMHLISFMILELHKTEKAHKADFICAPLSGRQVLMTLGRHWFSCTHGRRCAELRRRQIVDHADVARNTHLVHVESFSFNCRSHAKAEDEIVNLERNEGEDADRNHIRADANDLRNKLRGVSIK